MTESSSLNPDLLRRAPYFTGLPDDVFSALARVATSRRYTRGQMIFLEGEPCAGLFVVAVGEVKVFKLSPQGREQMAARTRPALSPPATRRSTTFRGPIFGVLPTPIRIWPGR
jgi:CRP/FNR family cyclic AMP-dependent transcriptional regulator